MKNKKRTKSITSTIRRSSKVLNSFRFGRTRAQTKKLKSLDDNIIQIQTPIKSNNIEIEETQQKEYNKNLYDQNKEIVFVIDTTTSMEPWLNDIKKMVIDIIHKVNKCQFGVVCYRDYPPQEITYITRVLDLTEKKEDIKEFIMKQNAWGGGDLPEAVLEGLQVSLQQINWGTRSQKYIFHFGDSPPHGVEYGFDNRKMNNDQLDYIAKQLEIMKIEYTLINYNVENLDRMIKIFRQQFWSFNQIISENESIQQITQTIIKMIECP